MIRNIWLWHNCIQCSTLWSPQPHNNQHPISFYTYILYIWSVCVCCVCSTTNQFIIFSFISFENLYSQFCTHLIFSISKLCLFESNSAIQTQPRSISLGSYLFVSDNEYSIVNATHIFVFFFFGVLFFKNYARCAGIENDKFESNIGSFIRIRTNKNQQITCAFVLFSRVNACEWFFFFFWFSA